MLKNIKKIILLFILLTLFLPHTAKAQADKPDFNIISPSLQINIPGVNMSSVEALLEREENKNTNKTKFLHVPYLAEYIAGVYRYAISVASVLATIMIIFAGFQWLVSGGNAEAITRAKKRITNAVVGLLLALGSYALLANISHELVSFQSLKVNVITTSNLPIEIDELTEEDINSTKDFLKTSETWGKMPVISGVTYTGGSSVSARPDVIQSFTAAAKELQTASIKIFVNSAGRSPEYQYKIMQQKCGCPEISTISGDVNADGRSSEDWRSHCEGLKASGSGCNAAWKIISYKNKKLTSKEIGHPAGNALDISANTGHSIACSSSNDPKVLASKGVARFQDKNKNWIGADLCITEEQQKLIKIMLKHNFCVGLKDGSKLREPWHFELKSNPVQKMSFCVSATDPNVQKMPYTIEN